MARVHQRIFAIVAALLFLATTVGFSLAVIWQMRQDNQTNQQTNQTQGGKTLEGTKLEGFTPVTKVDSLTTQDLVVGTGAEAKADSTITAHYTGAVASTGIIFQSSHDGQNQPFSSPLSGLIKGWQEGIPGMKVGGKRRLLIPSAEAYGDQAQSGIPANSDLVFDIELIAVK